MVFLSSPGRCGHGIGSHIKILKKSGQYQVAAHVCFMAMVRSPLMSSFSSSSARNIRDWYLKTGGFGHIEWGKWSLLDKSINELLCTLITNSFPATLSSENTRNSMKFCDYFNEYTGKLALITPLTLKCGKLVENSRKLRILFRSQDSFREVVICGGAFFSGSHWLMNGRFPSLKNQSGWWFQTWLDYFP